MDYTVKLAYQSNYWYNDGLATAQVRDMSGAITSLKKSLQYNRANLAARNLLGLVYYERGEVVAALSEWVISKNLRPEKNIADDYINAVQKSPTQLEEFAQMSRKYNQALSYCYQDSKDLARIQLKKVLSDHPNFVQAHLLLALLYMDAADWEKARKELTRCLRIDCANTTALRYMHEVDIALKTDDDGKFVRKQGKGEEVVKYQSGNETIIQPKYLKDNSAMSTILNMVIGIAIGAAITGFLVVPGVRRQVQNDAKAQVLDANNTVSSKNQEISTLQKQIDDLTSQITEVKDSAEGSENKISTYDQLLSAYASYSGGDIEAAGNALGNVNEEYLSDSAKSVYETINAQVNADYLESLYNQGYSDYNSQKFEESITSLQKVVDMEETYKDGYALYYLAQAYRKNNDLETAKTYYQKIVELYPGTERAANAQNYLNIEE